MNSLSKILLFNDIVDLGSLSAAARRWRLSHSTVSKHLKSLEEQLGVVLLRRTSRTLSVTDEGRLVYDSSRKIGAHYDELLERLDELRGEVKGELRVSCLLHIGRHLVQPAMAAFLREHPQARVRLLLDDGPLRFYRDELDVAVRVGLPTEESLTARKLMSNDVCLVASKAFVEREGLPRHPSELTDYPTVAYATADLEISTWAYREGEEIKTVSVAPRLWVNDGNALLDAVRAGVGIGYLSLFAARGDLEGGQLVRVLPGYELPPYSPIYMLTGSESHVSPRIEAFKRHLLETAARLTAAPSAGDRGLSGRS